MSKNIASSEFYELVSDVKVEFVNSDGEHETNFGVPPEEQEQHGRNSNSALEHEGSSRDTFQVETPCSDGEIDIKYEVNEIEHNSTLSDAEDDSDNEGILGPLSHGSINFEKKELKELYLDLLQCERNCETCQKYIRRLSEHVRATHAVDQPTHDPLHIDPFDLDQSSAIELKCEGQEDIEGMDCSEESDSNSENVANGDSDLDYNGSHDLNRNRKSIRKLGKDQKRGLTRTRTHTGKQPFKCEESDKTFTKKENLIIHKKIHIGGKERPFKCEECAKGFERRNHLTIHIRSHTGERPYECKECAKTFASNSHLTSHMRIHTGKRPYKCGECVKSFKTKQHLTAHIRYHSGERPFKCEECKKGFKTSDKLGRHMKTHK